MQLRGPRFGDDLQGWASSREPATERARPLARPADVRHVHPQGPVLLDTPIWRGELVRFPESRENAAYFGQLLAGVRSAVTCHFEPWLAGGDRSLAGFTQLMKDMHAALGAGGYAGYMAGLPAERGIGAGCLLLESKNPSYRHWMSVDRRRVPELSTVDLDALPEGVSEVHLEGLPEGARGTNTKTTDAEGMPHLYHEYVPVAHHPAVLERMAARMETMRSPTSSLGQAVDAMAEYHHLGIHAQLFFRVNNSLLLAQLNHLLHAKGLRGIPHGVLDYAALLLPLSDYRTRFLAAVRAYNPELAG